MEDQQRRMPSARRSKVVLGLSILAAATLLLFGTWAVCFVTQNEGGPFGDLVVRSDMAVTPPGYWNNLPALTTAWGKMVEGLQLLGGIWFSIAAMVLHLVAISAAVGLALTVVARVPKVPQMILMGVRRLPGCVDLTDAEWPLEMEMTEVRARSCLSIVLEHIFRENHVEGSSGPSVHMPGTKALLGTSMTKLGFERRAHGDEAALANERTAAKEKERLEEARQKGDAMQAVKELEDKILALNQAAALAKKQLNEIHHAETISLSNKVKEAEAAAALKALQLRDAESTIAEMDMELARVRRWRVYGIVLDRDLCKMAAYNGDLPVLKLARAKSYPWDEKTCNLAARAGHLEVLKWAVSEGCSWSEETCFGAAWGGHLDVLAWARNEGCPWYKEDCQRAAKQNANSKLLEWIHANSSRN